MFRKSLVLSLAAVASVSMLAALLLGCQPAQPVPLGTPKAGETPAQKPAAVATAAKPAEKPVRGGTLRYVLISETASLDAHAVQTGDVPSILYDVLIQQDEDLNLTKEGQVKDWTVSADGKTITFKLREGVKFHDGTDLDAAAVKFAVERIKDPATKAPYASNYATVASVELVDSLTFRFQLKQPDPLLLPRLTQSGGRMVSPTAVKKYGQDFGRNPVGTSAFQFVEWAPGDHTTVKRFEGYWGKDKDGNQLPYLDQVVFKVVADETVAMAALRTGQVDLYGGASGFPPAQLTLLKADPNLTYTARGQSYITGMYLNTKRPPFDNKALRQAVALALDREGIAGLLGEGASRQASIFHPDNLTWGADPKIGVFPSRDLAKSKAKMAEASYPSGGLKVKFTSGNSGQAIREAEVIKANLAEIGIEVEIEVLASAAHTSKVRDKMDYQIAFLSSGAGLADPGSILSIAFHSQGSRNYYGPYSNPKVDEALDKAGSIYDQKERTALYNEAAKMIADDMPYIPVYVGNALIGMNKKVRNFVPYPVPNDLRGFKKVWITQ